MAEPITEQYTQEEFISRVRKKYPMYNTMDDSTLYTRLIEKYPSYIDQISDVGKPIAPKKKPIEAPSTELY